VVFETLGIGSGDACADAQREKKLDDQIVSLLDFLSEFPTAIGEKDRTVWPGRHKPRRPEPGDGFHDGNVGDAQVSSEVHDSSFAVGFDEVGNELDVVLGELA
jgi:hypothetical protein